VYYLLVLIIRRERLTVYLNDSVNHIPFLEIGQKSIHSPKHFVEIFGLFPCTQEPVIGPCCKQIESSILPHTYHSKIYLNIILSSSLNVPISHLSLRTSEKKSINNLPLLLTCLVYLTILNRIIITTAGEA
jgi:hypothetical protein